MILPGAKLQWQFKAFYLYGAVEPLSGERFFLECSHHYSPELNPIERLWQHMKEQLSWVLFSTLDSLQQSVTDILHELTPRIIRSLIAYPFILSAFKYLEKWY
ncbi:hypothetical protein Noc_1335 [Nitrosococcus oceani ATCC 19707]|uniref:Tc1-like transposase DDE domain-containing protein n=1 Tax=Nitrosococcus oceani (strain ATCC 19707 / BCRC 17464 / JCM 30415 / NCIMB 11848 / C-107) TaxID=323261 RepID=Q3JBG5_NITOC|nr:transposase [Nitrosococcus oceani]ABA57831.1 hypothetical protein Noc_1335 [Nitrosococcus oceani ATCC 19707]EDZ68537.1 hypothetical protein NOC27_1864 [Nitrosococcus oceani AFC27]GEM19467.1 hypothetical protein NONS58_08540 [Nitrosococcus oceani]